MIFKKTISKNNNSKLKEQIKRVASTLKLLKLLKPIILKSVSEGAATCFF